MNVIIFGSTGMIGQGVLRECLLDPAVTRVATVVRRPSGASHAKLTEIVVPDLAALPEGDERLKGFDVCFFAVGVTSAGLSETEYSKVTLDLPVHVANVLRPLNPGMAFVFVSGKGADSTGQGRVMWARVKGRAENALLAMPFRAVYVLRPGIIQPLHGIESRTGWYNAFYKLMAPVMPWLRRVYPNGVTTTEQIGKAVLRLGRKGAAEKQILDSAAINNL